jgi:hypothetical protein
MKYYSIKKFVKLCLENNPNIVEMLFGTPDNIKYITPEMELLLKYREKFLSKNIVNTFIGYSRSQKQKMIIKGDKIHEMIKILDFMKEIDPKGYVIELKHNDDFKKLLESLECSKINKKGYEFYFKEQHLAVGDMNIPTNVFIKNATARIQERLDKASYRKDYILKQGFDHKFGQHVIRLLLEGRELLTTKQIIFPLTYASTLLEIKTGKWTVQDVIAYSEEIEQSLKELEKTTELPDKSDFNFFNDLIIEILSNSYK